MNSTQRPELVEIDLERLVPHPLNPNVMADELKEKVACHIRTSGRYPPIIARQQGDGRYQILDGKQRTDILRELGQQTAWCLVWECSDQEALLLLATLNQLRGDDLPARRAALVSELAEHESLAQLARLLPEDEAQIRAAVEFHEFDLDDLLSRLSEQSDREAAAAPQLFSFAVAPVDAPIVEAALDHASVELHGKNRTGRALVAIARTYVASLE